MVPAAGGEFTRNPDESLERRGLSPHHVYKLAVASREQTGQRAWRALLAVPPGRYPRASGGSAEPSKAQNGAPFCLSLRWVGKVSTMPRLARCKPLCRGIGRSIPWSMIPWVEDWHRLSRRHHGCPRAIDCDQGSIRQIRDDLFRGVRCVPIKRTCFEIRTRKEGRAHSLRSRCSEPKLGICRDDASSTLQRSCRGPDLWSDSAPHDAPAKQGRSIRGKTERPRSI